MGFFIEDDSWPTVFADYKELCEMLGVKPFMDKREIADWNKIYFPKKDGKYAEDGAISVKMPYIFCYAIAKKLQEKEAEVAALVKRLDDLSGWLASKELQQHLDARLKDLEEKFENREKKVDKPKRLR